MVILDTDSLSLLERADSPEKQRLLSRLAPLPIAEKAATIISFEEQSRGWLAVTGKAKSTKQLIEAYRHLQQHLENYCKILVLQFDEPAAIKFQELRKAYPRLGAMDLRIAAIALIHDDTVITRNLRHFRPIAGLKVED